MAATEITVIIPTYNRVDRLVRCLEALERQTLDGSRVEILVVDDGSNDGTGESVRPFLSDARIRYFRQPNSGPARARNVGIRAATGRLLLFIGDDIMATPHLLERHIACHERTQGGPVAVVGLTEWSNRTEITPLMRYPAKGAGSQFAYHEIERGLADPNDLPYRFFYTSNASIARAFLLENDLFFDEEFVDAMGEDGELAYRMQQKGLRLVYEPAAMAYHEHPVTFESTCRRSFLLGKVAVLQARKHPEWADLQFLDLRWRGRARRAFRRWAARVLSPLLRLADERRWDIQRLGLHRMYDFVFDVHTFEGLLHGLHVYGAGPRR